MSGETNPPNLSAKIDKKRKRHAEDSASSSKKTKSETAKTTDTINSNNSEGVSKRKLKKAKKDKKKGLQEEKQDVKEQERKDGIDESIGKMDGPLLADYIAQRTLKLNKELTAVELADLYVPESAILDTSSFESPRSMEQLPEFLKTFSPKGSDLSKSSEEKGSPHTIVIAPAALRAADLVRALRTFRTEESMIAKLFAKHIKLEDAKQFLQRSRVAIGVGTPARISDLIASGTLKLNDLERVVIDGSYIDQKKRGIFDMKETHFPLLQLLTRSELRERYGVNERRAKILVF